jgi:hypothetical protein
MQFPQILVPDLEKTAPKQFRYDASGDATEASERIAVRAVGALTYAPKEPLVAVAWGMIANTGVPMCKPPLR